MPDLSNGSLFRDHQRLDNAIASAIRNHRPPAPDFLADLRALASLLEHIHTDSPERAALLRAANLPADSLSPRQCLAVARGLLNLIDSDYPCRDAVTWMSLPNPSRDEDDSIDGINTIRLSSVVATEVNWAWKGRFPFAKLSLICGDPEVGKTWVMLDMFARLTTGRAFADGPLPPWGRCDCLFATAEDGLADTIKPRMTALGADTSRVHILKYVIEERGGRRKQFALDRHVDKLTEHLALYPMIRFVGLDPLVAYLGKVDSNKNSDVRGVLTPLAEMAETRGVGIVGINHFTKGEGKAMYRSMGSIAFNAAARAVWQVTKDRDLPGKSLLTLVKSNLKDTCKTGLAFRCSDSLGISWEEEIVTIGAEEALNGASPKKQDMAKDLIRDMLKGGPALEKKIKAAGKAADISGATINIAKRQLGVVSDRVGGTHGVFWWKFPEKSEK